VLKGRVKFFDSRMQYGFICATRVIIKATHLFALLCPWAELPLAAAMSQRGLTFVLAIFVVAVSCAVLTTVVHVEDQAADHTFTVIMIVLTLLTITGQMYHGMRLLRQRKTSDHLDLAQLAPSEQFTNRALWRSPAVDATEQEQLRQELEQLVNAPRPSSA
jgi:hypothetical protein